MNLILTILSQFSSVSGIIKKIPSLNTPIFLCFNVQNFNYVSIQFSSISTVNLCKNNNFPLYHWYFFQLSETNIYFKHIELILFSFITLLSLFRMKKENKNITIKSCVRSKTKKKNKSTHSCYSYAVDYELKIKMH